jgi:ABC-type xylose transport system substrate-binding protein
LHASGDEAVHINKQTKIIAAAEPALAQQVIKGDEQPVATHERAPEPQQQQQADSSPQTTRQDEETPGKLI